MNKFRRSLNSEQNKEDSKLRENRGNNIETKWKNKRKYEEI